MVHLLVYDLVPVRLDLGSLDILKFFSVDGDEEEKEARYGRLGQDWAKRRNQRTYADMSCSFVLIPRVD
jgi:hypothetical protein